jgi:hypothetical protein
LRGRTEVSSSVVWLDFSHLEAIFDKEGVRETEGMCFFREGFGDGTGGNEESFFENETGKEEGVLSLSVSELTGSGDTG